MSDINNDNIDCSEVILSEDYADFIVEYGGNRARLELYNPVCRQIINSRFSIIHARLAPALMLDVSAHNITTVPECYSLLDISNLENSGIVQLHNQPFLQLRGQGTIIGLIDTGIDYTNSVFTYEDNTSKIINIWDQTIQGAPPEGFQYGTEYTNEQINEALNSDNPYSIVPSVDELGHGTYIAGIAAGREDFANNFIGAAPDADIIMVKLKPAKNYLRQFYLINPDIPLFQETDIMTAVKYLTQKSLELQRPMAICIGLGNNLGDHNGTSELEIYLNSMSNQTGVVIVIAAGNEANLGHHYYGVPSPTAPFEDVELKVGNDESGFMLQIWGKAPDIYSVAIQSPSGEFIPEIPPRLNYREEIRFLLERTVIYVEYQIVEERTGDQLILMRFQDPVPGIWTLRVFTRASISGVFNIWLPREGWINPDTFFIRSNPDITLTSPGTSPGPICVGAYNHKSDGIYINSSRGYTRDGRLKPDLTAPGVNVLGPLPGNVYGPKTGTSVSAAHVAGASALLLEWGIINGNDQQMESTKAKNYLIRGCTRKPGLIYPNREWGYGMLNLLNTFESLRF